MIKEKPLNESHLDRVLNLLESRIRTMEASPIGMVVCGGSALIATKLITRTTKDVDILAFREEIPGLIDPEPMPDSLIEAARIVSQMFNLPKDWLNTGPADLFRMGLPEGFESRLFKKTYGSHLTVYFISRLDQIHFKLYASVDQGGYHIEDLLALKPTDEELIMASKWSMTHDISDSYAMILKDMLIQLGYKHAAEQI